MSTNRLSAARDAADAARVRHAEDTAALNRGSEHVTAAQAALDALADEDAAAVSRAARRFERQVREGKSGPLAQLAPSDEHLARQIAATRTYEAAAQMLESLKSAERESAAVLAAAEEELRSAVLAAIGEEANALAAAIEQLRSELKAKEELLSAVRNVPDLTPSAAVFHALRDDLNTPIAELGHSGDWDTPVADLRLRPTPLDAATHWRQRIEQLTNADPTPAVAAA